MPNSACAVKDTKNNEYISIKYKDGTEKMIKCNMDSSEEYCLFCLQINNTPEELKEKEHIKVYCSIKDDSEDAFNFKQIGFSCSVDYYEYGDRKKHEVYQGLCSISRNNDIDYCEMYSILSALSNIKTRSVLIKVYTENETAIKTINKEIKADTPIQKKLLEIADKFSNIHFIYVKKYWKLPEIEECKNRAFLTAKKEFESRVLGCQ